MRSSLALLAVAAVICTSLSLVAAADVTPTPFPYSWETRWWNAQIDNLNFGYSGQTFPLKYLIAEQYYKPGGPIFFYTGNEGPIELFANNTGFMWDIAPEFGALIVFAEHRYYGESLPFGAASFTNTNYQHLSAEQALADYAYLLTSLKQNMSIPDAKVISFGGSYGGMLTSWFRKAYPNIVAGGIAGSAPIWMFDTLSTEFDPGTYNRIVSNDFKAISQACFDNIAGTWTAMQTIGKDAPGLIKLSELLGLCPGQLQQFSDIENLLWNWMQNVYSSMPMGDYPYPASFISPMPGYPVNVTCGYFAKTNMTALELMEGTRLTANMFYNFTGQAGKCHNLTDEQGLASLGAGNSWPVQSCTEMVMPIGQYGPPNDFFYPAPWSLEQDIQGCQQQFGFTPQPLWISTRFGVRPEDWVDATNIVFSNGNLDPWRGGGVLMNLSSTLIAVPVIGGAHHSDLRAADPRDPPGVTWAREQERDWIRQFLQNPTPNVPPPEIIYNNTVIVETVYVNQTVYIYLNDTGSTDNGGLSKPAVALISVFSTLGAAAIAVIAYAWCIKKPAQSLLDVDTRTGSTYSNMEA